MSGTISMGGHSAIGRSPWLASAGEACNVIKKLNRKRDSIRNQDPELHELQAALADEIADTVTYAFLLAERCGFDMGKIVARKFNQVSDKYGFPQHID